MQNAFLGKDDYEEPQLIGVLIDACLTKDRCLPVRGVGATALRPARSRRNGAPLTRELTGTRFVAARGDIPSPSNLGPNARFSVEYLRPTDTDTALRLLEPGGAHVVGGGTDLVVTMREGIAQPSRIVDVRGLPDIGHVRVGDDGSLSVGAGAGIHTLGSDEGIRRLFPALAESCESVGSPALRNMGTIGGNLCQRPRCWYFRSAISCLKSGGGWCPARDGENRHHVILGGGPCFATHPSDPAVALTALEAVVKVAGPRGVRAVPIGEFFVSPDVDPTRETVLERGEFVVSVEVPAHSATPRQRYIKVLQRGAWDFALASVAVVRRADGAVRMVLGGVAPRPWRVSESVEEDVASGPLAEEDLDALAERALYDARPLSQNAYKVELARVLLRQAMTFASRPDSTSR